MTTYPLEAHKRFKWVMLAFLANAIFAALTIFSKDILPITATYYLARIFHEPADSTVFSSVAPRAALKGYKLTDSVAP